MNPNQTIIDLAKSYGFDGAEHLTEWNGFQVFSPTTESEDAPIVGEPILILYDGKDTRVAARLEWEQILDALADKK